MIGWRARLGFLLPPGNPTIEPEMIALAPEGVSVHFHRMTARGATGSLEGQDERNRMMVDNIDVSIELLAMVKPDVIVVAHTATSYYLGRQGEADLLARLQRSTGKRVITAFGSVVRSLERLNIRRLARMVDREDAEAVFLSGTGMPTLPVLELLEQDLGKPVISSASAMMWHALRLSGIGQLIPGYGRLLTLN